MVINSSWGMLGSASGREQMGVLRELGGVDPGASHQQVYPRAGPGSRDHSPSPAVPPPPEGPSQILVSRTNLELEQSFCNPVANGCFPLCCFRQLCREVKQTCQLTGQQKDFLVTDGPLIFAHDSRVWELSDTAIGAFLPLCVAYFCQQAFSILRLQK